MKKGDWASEISNFHRREKLLEGLTADVAISRANGVSDSFENVAKSYRELMALKERLKPTIWEELKLFLGPMLIALALAVRFGKTTADIKRKQSNIRNGQHSPTAVPAPKARGPAEAWR